MLLLWVRKLSEVERSQKLGCVPFLSGKKSLTAGGKASLTDRMWGRGRIGPLDQPVCIGDIRQLNTTVVLSFFNNSWRIDISCYNLTLTSRNAAYVYIDETISLRAA